MTSLGIARALAPYQRRAILAAFLRSLFVAVVIALLATELLTLRPDIVGMRASLATTIALALGLLVSVIYARVTAPALRDVARRVDRAARLSDLIVTAAERDELSDEVSAVVSRAAVAALRTVPAARVYPIQAPRQWRRWAALAAAVQVIAIGLTWRAPDARPMPASGTGLSLPGGGTGQDTASGTAATAGSPTSVTPAATAAGPTLMNRVAVAGRDAVSAVASAGDAAASGTGAAGDTATSAVASPSERETASGRNGYRQAANRVSDAIARGRVPAALRGVVERYFTAIRPQGQ